MGGGSKLFGIWEQENGENTKRNRKELGEVERCLRSGCVKLDETLGGWLGRRVKQLMKSVCMGTFYIKGVSVLVPDTLPLLFISQLAAFSTLVGPG